MVQLRLCSQLPVSRVIVHVNFADRHMDDYRVYQALSGKPVVVR